MARANSIESTILMLMQLSKLWSLEPSQWPPKIDFGLSLTNKTNMIYPFPGNKTPINEIYKNDKDPFSMLRMLQPMIPSHKHTSTRSSQTLPLWSSMRSLCMQPPLQHIDGPGTCRKHHELQCKQIASEGRPSGQKRSRKHFGSWRSQQRHQVQEALEKQFITLAQRLTLQQWKSSKPKELSTEILQSPTHLQCHWYGTWQQKEWNVVRAFVSAWSIMWIWLIWNVHARTQTQMGGSINQSEKGPRVHFFASMKSTERSWLGMDLMAASTVMVRSWSTQSNTALTCAFNSSFQTVCTFSASQGMARKRSSRSAGGLSSLDRVSVRKSKKAPPALEQENIYYNIIYNINIYLYDRYNLYI